MLSAVPPVIAALALATPIALAVVAAAVLPRTGSKALWALARAPPLGVLAARGLLSRREAWGPLAACASQCPSRLAATTLVAAVEEWGCPPWRVIEESSRRGLLAPVYAAAARGCRSPEEAPRLYEAVRALLGAWPRGSTVVYACYSGVTAVRVDGETYSSLDLPEGLRRALPGRAPARGGVFLLRSGCPGGGISLEDLSIKVLPEAPPRLPWLLYHLGLPTRGLRDPEALAGAVEAAARRLAWIAIESLGREAPWEAYAVRERLGLEAPECPGETVLTDKPVLGCPYYSPYTLRDPGPHHQAWAHAARSLIARGGNPVRAAVNLALYGHRRDAEAILRLLTPGVREPPRGPVQVEPWYAGCSGVKAARARCARPPVDCYSWEGPGPVEQWAWRLGLEVEPARCGRPSQGRPPGPPERVEGRVLEPRGDPLGAAARLASEAAGSGGIAVVGLEAGARLLRGLTGLPSPWEEPEAGGVASWERLELEPWVLEHYDTVVHLYPEKYPKPGHLLSLLPRSPARYLEAAASWVRWLVLEPGSGALSRLLEPSGSVEGEAPRLVPDAGRLVGELEALFRRHWGARHSLRPHQALALRAILEAWRPPPGRPVLSVFPTGYGKSAIFQLAGLLLSSASGGYTLVVSPLRALIRDQVEALLRRGLPAARIDSSVTGRRREAVLRAAALGLLDFLYVTPERFQDPAFYASLAGDPPPLAVLDEAHTVVKWGGSFRPSYYYAARSIQDLRSEAGRPHVALFTASAPGPVARHILGLFGVVDPVEVRLGSGGERLPRGWEGLILRAPTVRDNIFFTALETGPGAERVRDIAGLARELAGRADRLGGPWIGVVFTSYVKSERHEWANAEALAGEIERLTGIPAIAYHGQLGEAERRRREDAIYEASRTGRGPRIVVATKAFGMGVDIPNIRWIIHALPSDSVLDYYQEAGRAGRDGLPAYAVHLYRPEDFDDKRRMILLQRPRPSQVLQAYNTIVSLHSALKRFEGWPLVVLPLDAFPAAERLVKAADYLRSAGVLDYWIVQQAITAYVIPGPGDAVQGVDSLPWAVRIGRNTYLAPSLREAPASWRRVEPRFYTCRQRGPLIPFRVEAGGSSVWAGECDSWKSVSLPPRPRLLMVFLDPDRRHGIAEVLGPDLFAHVTRLGAMELDDLEEYRSIVERASRLAAKHGWDSPEVDRYIKEAIDRHLSTPPPSPAKEPPSHLLGPVHTCPSRADCARRAAEIALEAGEWLGSPRAVSIALQDEGLAGLVEKAYRELAGRDLESPVRGVYKRVLQLSREGHYRLMDLGYVIVLARATQRTLEALSRLDGYPYHARLLYP